MRNSFLKKTALGGTCVPKYNQPKFILNFKTLGGGK